MKKSSSSKKNSLTSQDFIQNYQKVVNNYSNAIKFYTNNMQIMDVIEKIIIAYKETIISFKKKLIQIKINVIKPFYNEEKKSYKYEENIYSFYNNYIFALNQILNFQIDLISNFVNDIDKNLFSEEEKKRSNDYMNSLQQNKNNIQTNQKKIEKLYNEYNSEHKKFCDTFNLIEEDVQKYQVNKRKKIKQEGNNTLNELYDEANCTQNIFLQTHNKFQESNKKYFDYYNTKLKEFGEETLKNENYIENNINSFLKSLQNSIKSFLNSLEDLSKENNLSFNQDKNINELEDNLIINDEQSKKEEKKSNDFITFQNGLLPINSNYINDKYKVRSIHCRIVGDFQPIEIKKVMNNIFDEMGLEEYVETSNILLTDEDVFESIKFFYERFNFVDTSEYNFFLEKHKIEVRKLTNKLLQPGLTKKESKEYQDLKPMNANDVKKLEEYIKKGKDFRICFLLKINHYRTLGVFDMPEREFEITSNIFLLITNIIYNENMEECETFRLICILSQTFYFNSNGEKIYLYNKIKGHKMFTKKDFLKKYIYFIIKEELDKGNNTSNRPLKSKEKKGIVFACLLPFCKIMLEFGVKKEMLLEINEALYKEYELSEDLISSINMIVESQ